MKQELVVPSAEELILCKDPSLTCETYLFEPSPEEEKLGFLFAAGETQDRGGIGKQLLDTVITAIQREYYRETDRSSATSFEMALHQANLILYDSAESGVRDWMGHFHVAVGVLAKNHLHLSVAGAGAVFMSRKGTVTNISQGISHFPITDPLKTFSQVASGEVAARDTIFFTSSTFDSIFRSVDVGHFALEHSASTIAARLEQLYLDQGHRAPLALTIVALLPQYISEPKQEASSPARKTYATAPAKLEPRKALIVKRSWAKQIVLLAVSIFSYGISLLKRSVVPAVKRGSTGAVKKIPTVSIRLPKPSWRRALAWAFSLPRSSKIFAGIAILLLVALGISLLMLRSKRASDQAIELASQSLHQAQTKLDAAKTALIYDNREQATKLLGEAKTIAQGLQGGDLYEQETTVLLAGIREQQDRLQKIFRSNAANTKTIGDFASEPSQKAPRKIFLIDNAIYGASPDTNAILKMGLDGAVSTVRSTTSGIGLITDGSAQPSDKTITFRTDANGLAIFDAKDATLSAQTIDYPSENPAMEAISVFGNRLYIYDSELKNILSFNKTLRGFTGGSLWITDEAAKNTPITSIAIDGSIYSLSKNGTIARLFRGEAADFVQDTVDPSLSSASKIMTSDTMSNLYVLDPSNKRIVIYTKKGALVRQLFLEESLPIADIAVAEDESAVYLLVGTRVLSVSLAEGQ